MTHHCLDTIEFPGFAIYKILELADYWGVAFIGCPYFYHWPRLGGQGFFIGWIEGDMDKGLACQFTIKVCFPRDDAIFHFIKNWWKKAFLWAYSMCLRASCASVCLRVPLLQWLCLLLIMNIYLKISYLCLEAQRGTVLDLSKTATSLPRAAFDRIIFHPVQYFRRTYRFQYPNHRTRRHNNCFSGSFLSDLFPRVAQG